MDIDKAITTLTDLIANNTGLLPPADALHYSQAALNLAHTKQVMGEVEASETKED